MMGRTSRYHEIGADVEELYIRQGKTLDVLSEMFGVLRVTLHRWRKKYEWDKRRDAYLRSRAGRVAVLEEVLDRKIEELKNKKAEEIDSGLLDGYYKLTAMIFKLKEQDDLRAQAVNVMQRFAQFIIQKELPETDRIQVTELVQEFLTWVRNS